ncbi:hypothetical protein E2C01_075756 [Portunus trituberculatus]|uniref:Uncharacterized protein n=1 Tax=Portunus trituberculatus TaxID=210409 RepID=A0A5B7IBG3_PORTR|nr:hypothetical protein [Portunus trituberculatus]
MVLVCLQHSFSSLQGLLAHLAGRLVVTSQLQKCSRAITWRTSTLTGIPWICRVQPGVQRSPRRY